MGTREQQRTTTTATARQASKAGRIAPFNGTTIIDTSVTNNRFSLYNIGPLRRDAEDITFEAADKNPYEHLKDRALGNQQTIHHTTTQKSKSHGGIRA